MKLEEFAIQLMVHQRSRNKAIGVRGDPEFVRGLGKLSRSRNTEGAFQGLKTLAKAAYLRAMIEEHQTMARRLIAYIKDNLEDKDIRNEGVYIVKVLEAHTARLGEELEALWQH